MALSQNNPILSSDITNLKARVNREMARRQYYGSLANYNQNFTNSANIGNSAKLTHFNETVGYINLIKATNISSDKIYDIAAAVTALGTYEARAADATVNDCSGYCTGLCISQCSTAVCKSGCGSSCSNCSNDCSAWCRNSCDLSCSNSCGGSHPCQQTCTSGCANWR